MTPRIRTLIVDDEPPARQRLRSLLEAHADIEIIGECGDGQSAVDFMETSRPDLVLLDVQMPELDGLGVVDAIGPDDMPCVIFVTAYDHYAVQAFGVAAVDYLLKPFDTERFEQALERARERLLRTGAGKAALAGLLAERARAQPATDRLAVRVGDRIRLVRTEDITYVSAEGNYVRVHMADGSHLLRHSISSMEKRLDPARFARLHRSLIVNTSMVRELEPLYRGEYVIWMNDGARLVSGRTYRRRVQEVFGV